MKAGQSHLGRGDAIATLAAGSTMLARFDFDCATTAPPPCLKVVAPLAGNLPRSRGALFQRALKGFAWRAFRALPRTFIGRAHPISLGRFQLGGDATQERTDAYPSVFVSPCAHDPNHEEHDVREVVRGVQAHGN